MSSDKEVQQLVSRIEKVLPKGIPANRGIAYQVLVKDVREILDQYKEGR